MAIPDKPRSRRQKYRLSRLPVVAAITAQG
ncbi:Fic family protein [Thauera sp. SDU_THAU2]